MHCEKHARGGSGDYYNWLRHEAHKKAAISPRETAALECCGGGESTRFSSPAG